MMQRSTHIGIALAFAFTAVFIGTAGAQDLPSADDLIAKYIKAIGGAAAIGKIKTRVVNGTFELPDMNMSATMTNFVSPPNMYSEIDLAGMGTVTRGISEGIAWEINFMTGARILEGAEKASSIQQASIEPFVNWKEFYKSAETQAEETVGDAPAYKVLLTQEEGPASTVFFDKESGLIVQMIAATPEGGMATSTISDYKEVDGVKIAHEVSVEGGQFNLVISFNTVEQNVDIPASTFALPDEIKSLQTPAESTDN